MKTISTILRIIANIFLFWLYALVAIVIENFIFGLIMVNSWNDIPAWDDPIHMALAIATVGFIALITFILRNVFYISLWKKEKIILKDKVIKNKIETKEEKAFDEEMTIYIDKEIK